jgi:hypothetical protein
VIDVGGMKDTVRLVISNEIAARYVALSHCWGGSSHCRTTKLCLEQHKNAFEIIALPKTVQDAVFIVRKLGLRYLWVDSLGIIQDDEDDWLREAGRMAAVYEGAYLTIAASASADGSGGCFVSREPQDLVRVPRQKGDAASGHMYLGIVEEDAARGLFNGPLNSRAWVLQEHLFARRTIHFAADQIYWECDKYIMGQDRSNLDLLWNWRFRQGRCFAAYLETSWVQGACLTWSKYLRRSPSIEQITTVGGPTPFVTSASVVSRSRATNFQLYYRCRRSWEN